MTKRQKTNSVSVSEAYSKQNMTLHNDVKHLCHHQDRSDIRVNVISVTVD